MHAFNLDSIFTYQQNLIEMIALGTPLEECLDSICTCIESCLVFDKASCSVLLLDGNKLYHGAAPSLPKGYCEQIDGLAIGPNVGSCGTASFEQRQIIVTNIDKDPRWADYKHIALGYGLKACWSTPILSSSGEVIGTFAIYYKKFKKPLQSHLEIIEYFSHLSSLVIEKYNNEKKIHHLAYYDQLTNLPNQSCIEADFEKAINNKNTKYKVTALLYLDLDNYKRVNDNFGQIIADKLINIIVSKWQAVIPKHFKLARIKGDEFVLIISEKVSTVNNTAQLAQTLSEDIIQSLSKPIGMERYLFKVSVSIGIYLIKDEMRFEPCFQRAMIAMSASKTEGKGRATVYNDVLQAKFEDIYSLEVDFNNAFKAKQLTTHFQPQVNHQLEIVGFEALARWQHSEKGMISPDVFIPIATNIGLLDDLLQVVVNDSCKVIIDWQNAHELHKDFNVSINISAPQLNQQLEHKLMAIISEYGLTPYYFVLEITESVLIEDMDNAIKILHELKQCGFRISIDDFGTGYSSLAYLNTFPIDEVKIDKSFIFKLPDDKKSLSVVEAICSISMAFDFEIVAEGVETEAQFQLIKQYNITKYQGYYFSKPLAKNALNDLAIIN